MEFARPSPVLFYIYPRSTLYERQLYYLLTTQGRFGVCKKAYQRDKKDGDKSLIFGYAYITPELRFCTLDILF